jgi:hypothetical protein
MRSRFAAGSLLLILALTVLPLDARVIRVEIASRSDVLDGRIFGDAGACQRITGHVYFSLPVANPHNLRIVDLRNAVNLKNGEVEFSSDLVAVRPKDAPKGNGSMLLETPHRGRGRIIGLVDGGDWDLASDAGDAWLLRNGFTTNERTITGLLRGDLMPSKVMPEIPLGHLILGNIGGIEYPVAAPDDPRNMLTLRDSSNAQRAIIPRAEWRFAHTIDGQFVSSDRHIHLNGSFQPGQIYEYVYVVADPVVAGVGFAVIRDFAAYAKHSPDAVTTVQRV